MSEIKKQRQMALSSFYAKLDTMLNLLNFYAVGTDCPPNCIYYKFCAPELQVETMPDDLTVYKVKDISKRIVNLFMESDNQVPLFSQQEENNGSTWDNQKTKLLDLVLELEMIGSLYLFTNTEYEKAVVDKWSELKNTIEDIKKIIKKSTINLFNG